MNITLNGEIRHLLPPSSLSDLLSAEGLAGRRVAIELNGEIIPRTRHEETLLNDGDIIEIVHALGGG